VLRHPRGVACRSVDEPNAVRDAPTRRSQLGASRVFPTPPRPVNASTSALPAAAARTLPARARGRRSSAGQTLWRGTPSSSGRLAQPRKSRIGSSLKPALAWRVGPALTAVERGTSWRQNRSRSGCSATWRSSSPTSSAWSQARAPHRSPLDCADTKLLETPALPRKRLDVADVGKRGHARARFCGRPRAPSRRGLPLSTKQFESVASGARSNSSSHPAGSQRSIGPQ
jgi:hypothetical protein